MSFAEGFGSAFSKSFNAGLDRAEEQRKDAFRIAYADLIENRKYNQVKKDKDEALVRSAKGLAKTAGISDDQWPVAYDLLSSGISADEALRQLQTGTISGNSSPAVATSKATAPVTTESTPAAPVKPTPEAAFPTPGVEGQPPASKVPALGAKSSTESTPPDATAIPEAPTSAPATPAPMAQQMSQTGMATPAPVNSQAAPAPTSGAPSAPPAPSATKATGLTGLLSTMSGKFNTQGAPVTPAPATASAPSTDTPALPAGASDAYARIGKAIGKTPEQVASEANHIYTPGSIVPSHDNIKFTPPPAIRKADPMADLPSAMAENYAAKAALDKDPSPANKARFDDSEVRRKAAEAAVTFTATAKSKADAVGQIDGVPAAVYGPDGSMSVAPVRMKPDGSGYVNGKTGQDIVGNVVPYKPEETKFLQDLSTRYGTQVKDIQEKTAAVIPMMRSAGIMSQLVDETGGQVLHPWTAGMARGLVGMSKDIGNTVDLINSAANADGIVPPQAIEHLRQQMSQAGKTDLSTFLGPDINNLAAKSALFEAQKTLLAYDMARANGQSGNGLSDKDFKVNKETIAGTTDKDTFKQLLANAIGQQLSSIKAGAQTVQAFNSDVDTFQSITGKDSPLKPISIDIDAMVKQANDPNVIKGANIVNAFGSNPTGAGMAASAANNQGITPTAGSNVPAGMTQVGHTPDGKPVYQDAQGNKFVQ